MWILQLKGLVEIICHLIPSQDRVDCSQSPIFPCDRRDRARLTVNGGHLDF